MHYHITARESLGLKNIVWPSSLPDQYPIEIIWSEMKVLVQEILWWNFTPGRIRELVEQEWKQYSVEQVNRYIMSMSRPVVACIASNGGHNLIFLTIFLEGV